MSTYEGTLTLTRTAIRGNSTPSASGQGGGIFTITAPGNATTITASTITGNSTAYSNAGVYNYHGTIMVTDSTISSNHAAQGGGGIAHNDVAAPCTITNSIIADNDADYGGGMYTIVPTRISGSVLSNNRATLRNGGALSVQTGTTTVVGSTFTGNTTNLDGGAIFVNINDMASVSVANSTFAANVAQGKGGAIDNPRTTQSGMLSVVDSTFRGNRAASGAAIFADAGATPTLIGNIAAGGTLAAAPTHCRARPRGSLRRHEQPDRGSWHQHGPRRRRERQPRRSPRRFAPQSRPRPPRRQRRGRPPRQLASCNLRPPPRVTGD